MTTQSWSTRIRHDSDATFREWGLEFNTKLAAAGLVQTADTGQINWTTVLRPGAGVDAGYEVWRFNDALQATAPIFFRIAYGTFGDATAPRMRFTVGTGSNGSGTITGTALTIQRDVHQDSGQVTDVARQSYLCVVAGFFGFNWKAGSGPTEASFFICRTCDSNGAPTAVGAMVHWGIGNSGAITARQSLRFAAPAQAFTAQTLVAAGALGMNPQCPTSSQSGTDIQVFLGWTITPTAIPLFGVCGVLRSELNTGGTFQATLVGSTPRTYITLNDPAGPFGQVTVASDGGLNIAMLWE